MLSGFSIHAAKQNCGEAVTATRSCVPMLAIVLCVCVLSNQAIHIVLTMATHAGWWLMLPCLPFHRDCQKLSCNCVAVAAPTLVLWCLWFPLHILHVLMPEDRIMTFFFFFLIHWHQKLLLLSWAHCECRASQQLCGSGLLDRACKVGHLVLHPCARRAN